MLKVAPKERGIVEQAYRMGKPLPDNIANAPELLLGLDLYFTAFMDLTTERPIGYGEGPIPWSAVRRWCHEHAIIGEQLEDMHYHIRKLDSVYLDHRAEQAKKAAADNGPKIIQPQNAGSGPRGRGQLGRAGS